MAVGDIYQIKLFSTIGPEEAVNVFYYQLASGVGGAEDLSFEFVASVVAAYRALCTSSVTVRQVQVVNGMLNTDQHVEDLSLQGTLAGVNPPNFCAVGFRRRTAGVGSRYSYKRFFGGGTGNMTGNAWNAAMITLMDTLAVALGAALEGVAGEYVPVQITGGFQLGVSPTYKQSLQGNWQLNSYVTHQDTRQLYSWINATP